MIEKMIIKIGIIFGVIFFPTLFKRPTYKLWIPFFLWNGLVNHLFDKILVKSKRIKYPVRFMPKVFDINFVYDYFICPYISIWFCQSTYNDRFFTIIKKLFLFALPQSSYEILLAGKTKSLEFKKGYRWYHSLLLIFVIKSLARGTFEIIKRITEKLNKCRQNNYHKGVKLSLIDTELE